MPTEERRQIAHRTGRITAAGSKRQILGVRLRAIVPHGHIEESASQIASDLGWRLKDGRGRAAPEPNSRCFSWISTLTSAISIRDVAPSTVYGPVGSKECHQIRRVGPTVSNSE
jgi:hypothetical protein